MQIHLVDGTYELFRAHFGSPGSTDATGREVGATRGFLASLHSLLRDPEVTHVACAFDHVIESFRNRLFPGYKTGEGLPEELTSQFGLVERAAHALGVVVWPMIEFEADDALATAAARFAEDSSVDRVVVCSPDKDLAQCVVGERVITLDRARKRVLTEAGVHERYGIGPGSIPDYLALVGDAADGIPGVPRWGEKSASAVLARYARLEAIPARVEDWEGVHVRGAAALAKNLSEHADAARLYKLLATLRLDVPIEERLADLEWRGARRAELSALCEEIGERSLPSRVARWRE